MEAIPNVTTVLCLFHTSGHAQEALVELERSGVPASSIVVLDHEKTSSGGADGVPSTLQTLGLPEKDVKLLSDGINSGGTVIVVSGQDKLTDKAEAIFARYRAIKIDQKTIDDNSAPLAATESTGGVIPIVEEELSIGKREVQRGGVRVHSRVVETPVEETVVLREEHATVERRPVNRALSQADVEALRIQSVEVTETAEVPVVAKSARVVEEVLINKESSENTKQISDSVRKTQVDVEPIETDVTGKKAKGSR